MVDVHDYIQIVDTTTVLEMPQEVLKLDQNHGKVGGSNSDVGEVVLTNNKFSPPHSPPLLVKIHTVELHEGIQEALLNNDSTSVTDELLVLTSQKYEENQGWHLGNDDKNYECPIIMNSTVECVYMVFRCSNIICVHLHAFIVKVFTIVMTTMAYVLFYFYAFIVKAFVIIMKTTINRYK